ncbi:SWAP (Suppressor-of-White-APricot)/surp domain-containing protein [Wolffia australiana]
MNEGDEDFVFYGTPIEREEEMSRRKRKAVGDAGQMRSLPVWKQEVTDEEGRRRFHGAFTGGFSAGYYNTVGSKEGWTPQTFTSSRKNRAEVKKQSVYSFLDDDEKVEMGGHGLETSSQFDTFGFTAAEVARKQAEKDQKMRPSAIPGPVPDEIVLPAANSIGVKLLMKMGWRHGHSIKNSHSGKLYDARREARKAFLALTGNNGTSDVVEDDPGAVKSVDIFEIHKDTPVFVLEPKKDLHGLGFDPFKNAPEFRDRKAAMVFGSKAQGTKRGLFTTNSGKAAPGFGIGALEESGVEDEDIFSSGFEFEEPYVEEEPMETLRTKQDSKLRLTDKEHGVLVGFRLATDVDYFIERFPPPAIPGEFRPYHKFLTPLQAPWKTDDMPPPPEAPPPEEKDQRILIEGFAALVSRCGKIYEDLSQEKNKTNPLFSFLRGGNGYDFYVRKLWEEQQKRPHQRLIPAPASSAQKLTAEARGRILGEKPLKRTEETTTPVQLQYHLADSFTMPSSLAGVPESEKPFRDDPLKQARFEQFIKDKYEGGLRSISSSVVGSMSEAERARERLDFEAAAEALSQGKNKRSSSTLVPPVAAMQFVSSGTKEENAAAVAEKKKEKNYPKREEFQWRPAPILCKRFDLIDPFMGKPPPPPRARSKVETLIIMPEILKSKLQEAAADAAPSQPSDLQEPDTAVTERPVDLYKAIFSDDEEDGEEGEKKALDSSATIAESKAGANSTLNKLIAGDFLQSLGQELGLAVPDHPSVPVSRKPSGIGDPTKLVESSSKGKSAQQNATDQAIDRRRASDGYDSENSHSDTDSGSHSDSGSKRKKKHSKQHSSHRSRSHSKHHERRKRSPSRRSRSRERSRSHRRRH